MAGRRGVLFGLAAVGTVPAAAAMAPAPVGATEAMAALMPWIEAVASGDRPAVARLLAPEFQILRSDGVGYDKAGYLAALPEHRATPEVSDVQATGDAGSLVVRYKVTVDETVSAGTMRGTAPRLSTLRRDGGIWLMVAHANFAAIG